MGVSRAIACRRSRGSACSSGRSTTMKESGGSLRRAPPRGGGSRGPSRAAAARTHRGRRATPFVPAGYGWSTTSFTVVLRTSRGLPAELLEGRVDKRDLASRPDRPVERRTRSAGELTPKHRRRWRRCGRRGGHPGTPRARGFCPLPPPRGAARAACASRSCHPRWRDGSARPVSARPPASGDTTSIAHSGRSRSSDSPISSPTSRRSPASSAAPRARRWRSIENAGSSTHRGGLSDASRARSRGTASIRSDRRSRTSPKSCSPSTTITLHVWPRTLPDSSARIRASSGLSGWSVICVEQAGRVGQHDCLYPVA